MLKKYLFLSVGLIIFGSGYLAGGGLNNEPLISISPALAGSGYSHIHQSWSDLVGDGSYAANFCGPGVENIEIKFKKKVSKVTTRDNRAYVCF